MVVDQYASFPSRDNRQKQSSRLDIINAVAEVRIEYILFTRIKRHKTHVKASLPIVKSKESSFGITAYHAPRSFPPSFLPLFLQFSQIDLRFVP